MTDTHRRWDFGIGAGGILFVALIVLRFYPLGSPTSWVALYREEVLESWSPLLLGSAIVLTLAILRSRTWLTRVGPRWLMVFLVTACVGLNLCLNRPFRDQVFLPRVLVNSISFTNPFFSSGVRIESLEDFFELDRQLAAQDWWSVGVAERRLLTHPPGLPVLYHAVSGLATASKPVSDVLVVLGCVELKPPLTRADYHLPEDDGLLAGATLVSLMHLIFVGFIPIGVFGVASLYSPSGEAYRAAILSCFVPSFHLYSAVPDSLFPIIGLAIVWTAARSVRSNHVGYLAANAVLFALGLALKFSVVPFGLYSLLIILVFSGDLDLNSRMRNVAIWVGFGCCLYIGLKLSAFDIVQRFVLAVANNQSFYSGAGRTYGESFLFNLLTFAGFCGIVIVVGYLRQLSEDMTQLKKTGWPAIGAGPQLNLLFSGVIVLLLLTGSTRGEVERVWMLFMPFVALGAARWNARDDRRLVLCCLVSFAIAYTMCLMIEVSFTF